MTDTTAALTADERERQAGYDALHAARARSDLAASLYAQAMGDAHPVEVEASSSCDWPLLGTITAALRMPPGGTLVDLGCGTGGIGLWLARALAARVSGVDLSPRAIALAVAHAADFLPPARATYQVGTLERTALSDAHADGLVCVDAAGNARDRTAALREMHRILAPGARAVITAATRTGTQPPWEERAHAAGLDVEAVTERPDEPAMWGRLYRLWQERAGDLRRELGEDQARAMLDEAGRRLPTLADRRAVVLTLRRPLRCTDRLDIMEAP